MFWQNRIIRNAMTDRARAANKSFLDAKRRARGEVGLRSSWCSVGFFGARIRRISCDMKARAEHARITKMQ